MASVCALVDDDPPAGRPSPVPDAKPEREDGLWQRVGEYWWLGLNASSSEAAWTGKHDEHGVVFPASVDGDYAWSAAFVSYVMRIAGATSKFPYSPNHSRYIDIAKQVATGEASGWITLRRTAGELRAAAGRSDLLGVAAAAADRCATTIYRRGSFPVIAISWWIAAAAEERFRWSAATSMTRSRSKHVPVTPDGKLANPDGASCWMGGMRGWWCCDSLLAAPAAAGQIMVSSRV